MKKHFLILIVLTFVLISCENTGEKTVSNTDNGPAAINDIVVIYLKDFHSQAENLVGKTIVTYGTVDHVCKHGGQKMVIVSKNTDKRLKVLTGKNMAAFNEDIEGENVMVTGIVDEERVDENYLREWEEEVKSSGIKEMEKDKLHTGEGHEKQQMESEFSAELEKINNLRKKLKESEKGYLSFYSLICQDYKVIDSDETAPEN